MCNITFKMTSSALYSVYQNDVMIYWNSFYKTSYEMTTHLRCLYSVSF